MKKGYECECGWTLGRGRLTRKQYAAEKVKHAETCNFLKKELEDSQKVLHPGK